VDGEGGTVVALGARSDGTVSLAYRGQGSGVLLLSGADWQDSDPAYTDSSKSLFGAMIVASFTPQNVTPVPVSPLWLLGCLVGLLAFFSTRKLRAKP
ncbi:MAG: hypothetical protein RIC38_12100, partial [Chromatocurvus sp.]